MVADELRRQADNFIELQDLQPAIARSVAHREDRNAAPAPPTAVVPDTLLESA
jgi:hypothetical protein